LRRVVACTLEGYRGFTIGEAGWSPAWKKFRGHHAAGAAGPRDPVNEGNTMKRIARKAAFGTAAAVIALGVVALPTAAEADTGWSWRIVHSKSK
jgi:hypothetical protein